MQRIDPRVFTWKHCRICGKETMHVSYDDGPYKCCTVHSWCPGCKEYHADDEMVTLSSAAGVTRRRCRTCYEWRAVADMYEGWEGAS